MQQINEFNAVLIKNGYYINNSENSKTYDPHRLYATILDYILFKLSNKTNLKRSDKCVALSNLNIYYTWISIKKVILKQ